MASEAVCIASGPSLTADDVDLVRKWRERGTERLVLVCNNGCFIAPWADVLYAHDKGWWQEYGTRSEFQFAGEMYCPRTITKPKGVQPLPDGAMKYGNSGADLIALAISLGASRIILLGYDLGFQKGQRHWHGDHPKHMGNAGSWRTWPEKFGRAAAYAKFRDVEVVNASRATRLKVFPLVTLEDALT